MRVARGGDQTFRLRDVFDYIAGTSTGAIIAAGLMFGRSAEEIKGFYLKNCREMFRRAPLWRVLRSGV